MKRNETEKRTISISTDDGYRSVAQLNGKGTATGKENKHWKRQRTFAKLKCKNKKKKYTTDDNICKAKSENNTK